MYTPTSIKGTLMAVASIVLLMRTLGALAHSYRLDGRPAAFMVSSRKFMCHPTASKQHSIELTR